MKSHFIALGALAMFAVPALAEDACSSSSSDSYSPSCGSGSLAETVAKIEKKTDKFNVYLNMQGDLTNEWTGDNFDGAKFEMRQLRLEMKGNINDWISYRYRQRLNKGDATSGYFDNVLKSIDIAGIGLKKDNVSAFLGKQCAAYGGIEFDLNPIEIYQYSDMVDYMSNFMTGVNLAYDFTPGQQVQFQVLDALNGTSQQMYGNYEPAKIPLIYTVNWNGNFCDVFKTRWSASMMNETKGEHMWYFALGNEFNFTPKFGAYFDWLYSREGVDRKGIMTSIIPTKAGYNASGVDYMSYILHLNYRISDSWNIFAKGMYETAGLYEDQGKLEQGKYRTALGYIGGIEYYPLKDKNLHFFVSYIGRNYQYTDAAKALGQSDYNTNRVSAGFIWQMPMF